MKEEDRAEQWYADWIDYQGKHQIYARLLSGQQYSTLQTHFDLRRYARFLERIAYFSPAHGYSLQVTFLGLFSILAGSNERLKREAIAVLEAGGLYAFGVSEKNHGSDILANEFIVRENEPGQLIASGWKYYIGNSNCASMISILARRADGQGERRSLRRAPFVLLALRPKQPNAVHQHRKIRTLGVRSAFVGEFHVKDCPLPQSDVIAEGRGAWDAVFRSVTLGKFFLGFGSIGICEHAFAEAAAHLAGRKLYGKPVIEMPHIRSKVAQAYARLAAMKLFAYRAVDYLQSAAENDRRYLLFCAVQKARTSTEGVKIMALLSECIGAKGFESDTYFEMALRDVQLIPGLEGSAHINLGLAAQFIPQYFKRSRAAAGEVHEPDVEASSPENPYLMRARTGAIGTIAFPHFQRAYEPLIKIRNIRLFSMQCKALSLLFRTESARGALANDQETAMAFGSFQAIAAYGQLIAESSHPAVSSQLIAAIFHLLANDLSCAALALSGNSLLDETCKRLLGRMVVVPQTSKAEWDAVADHAAELARESAESG